MMLHVEHVRAGEMLGAWDALNEVVVGRGHLLRPVRLSASVDGRHLTSYVADGLIASTATGSTAYALAAGSVGAWLGRRPRVMGRSHYLSGAVYLALGGAALVTGGPQRA